MVPFFAETISHLISEILGDHLQSGGYCIITTPKRRHKVLNFATRISISIAEKLGIPFYEDVCSCRTKQRVGAQNIICFDDFVTTGQTLQAMQRALAPYNKNMVFITGINNIL